MDKELEIREQIGGEKESYNGMVLLGVMDITQEGYTTRTVARFVGISDQSVRAMCDNSLLKPFLSKGRVDSSIIKTSFIRGGKGSGRSFQREEILKAAYIVGLVLDEYKKYHPPELSSYGSSIISFTSHSMNEFQLFYVFLGLLNGSKAQLLTERMQDYPEDNKVKGIFNNALAKSHSFQK